MKPASRPRSRKPYRVLFKPKRYPSPALKRKLHSIPTTCGVYRFFNRHGQILYIGKAINLQRRVKQYFGSSTAGWDNRIRSMIPSIHDLDWLVTGSELEALLLEDFLIKSHWPNFNTRQKKFLLYTYLSFSDDLYPFLTIRALPEKTRNGTFFGPLTDGYCARDLLENVNTALGLRRCTDPTPNRRCAHKLGDCLEPCGGLLDSKVYSDAVNTAKDFLRGGNDTLLEILANKMQTCSNQKEYLHAARLRDRLSFCRRYFERQQFFRRFLSQRLLIEDDSDGFFLFIRGRFVGRRESRQEIEQISVSGRSFDEEESTLFDRAGVVLAWLNNGKSDRRYCFLPAESP